MRRHEMTDAQWKRLSELQLPTEGWRGRFLREDRRTLNGIRWIAKTGAPWRDLPKRYGKWNSVYRCFCRWSQAGIWQKSCEAMSDISEGDEVMLDSTIVRAHQHAAGQKKQIHPLR